MLSKELDRQLLTLSAVVAVIREQMKSNDAAMEEEAVMAANAGMIVIAAGMKRGSEHISYTGPGQQKRFCTGIVPYYGSIPIPSPSTTNNNFCPMQT
jgi:hypothetical protein